MTRRGFTVEITSLARARMSSEERGEVYAWHRDHGSVRVYLWKTGHAWEAVLSDRADVVTRQSAMSPIEAFRKAAGFWDPSERTVQIQSVLSGPAA